MIETDACYTGIGAVFMQEGKPLAFLSKALSPRQLELSTYEKELLAISMAVQKWRTYLLGQRFVIKTDHEALKYFMEQKLTTLVQQKWLSKMLGFDYVIQYKKGKDNVVADALSRKDELEGSLAVMQSVTPRWSIKVINSLENDQEAQELLVRILLELSSCPEYSLQEGILRKGSRIYLGSQGDYGENTQQS